MKDMRAIVIANYGGPDVLREQRLPIPEASAGSVVVRVRAFGVNQAESYLRSGAWGETVKVLGIEAVGEVHDPGATQLRPGQRVLALMGGMGRTINGSYAEYVRVPDRNVVAIDSGLDWSQLAALPESYATAWTFLHHNLAVTAGQTLVVRGGTSALGQAAINLAHSLGAHVFATTRSRDKLAILQALDAEPLIDDPALSVELRRRVPAGVDGVLDMVGMTTLYDSLRMVRYGGRVAMAGFLGGHAAPAFDPLQHLPSGVQLSFFASAFLLGGPDVPLSQIPFGEIIGRVERGAFRAAPAHLFDLDQIVEAHRLLDSGATRGKIVVRV